MKTLLKILGILIIVLILLAFLLPIIFKGKLVEIAKEEINKNVKAKVDFTDFNLSLIKSFPNFNFGIEGLLITGVDVFESDTLANIGSIDITLDLMSVIKGDTYELKRIIITNPDIRVKVLKDGTANYDIAVESAEESIPESTTEESGPFMLTLKHFEIINGKLIYDDASLDTYLSMNGLNHKLSGDLSEDFTLLKTLTSIEKLTLIYDGMRYISNASVEYKADIDADLKNEIYTLKENDLALNQLTLHFDGSVAMMNEDINIVMTFNSPGTEFKHLLSIVPAVYTKDFETVQTSGKLAFNGNVKGSYTETSLPSFDVNLVVENAMFKYPDLPEAVTNVNIDTKIYSPGGDADNTIIDVSRFHLDFGKNPVDMKLLVKTPVSDPDIDCQVKGTFNLADVQKFYPLEEGEDLKGMFVTDIVLKGKLSAIEEEKYEEFTALGSMLIKGFEYKSSYVKDVVEISNAQLNFSPQYLDLVSMKTTIGRNDFNASGKIENYLAYALKDETLSGQFTTSSTYFNLNDLMTDEEAESQSQPETADDTTTLSIIEIPANINFRMLSSFDKLIYDNIEMENVNGKLLIENQTLTIENLGMNLLNGEMVMNGSYSTLDPEKPSFDFGLDIKKVDIQKAYNTFTIITDYAPIAKKTSGDFSTKVRMKSLLGKDMMPLYETMTGEGELSSTQLTIQDVNTLNKIGSTLNMEELKRMVIDKVLLQFKFIDGKLLVEPFDMKFTDITANLGGWTAIDETIEYVMNLKIPRAKFGGAANNALNSLVTQANAQGANISLGDMVSLDVLIGGTLSDPQIKTGLKEAGKNLMNDIKQQVQAEIEKKKEEITQEAREQAQKILDEADKQAKSLIAEAEKQAAQLRQSAAEGAKKIRDEADVQANKVEADGKKKGFIAEAAAKETGKKMRQEADKQANNVTKEADDKANAIIRQANDEANLIKRNAQKEADKILERN